MFCPYVAPISVICRWFHILGVNIFQVETMQVKVKVEYLKAMHMLPTVGTGATIVPSPPEESGFDSVCVLCGRNVNPISYFHSEYTISA